ncbi:MAG: CsbD family protein, partial [Leuconostoc falkenbergense]
KFVDAADAVKDKTEEAVDAVKDGIDNLKKK